jgi:hypothetical protein
MTDLMSNDVAAVKEAIQELRLKIEDRMAELHDKVKRIRDYAKETERHEVARAHAEIEPMRRQMESMVLSLARYEELKNPRTITIPANP